MLSWTASSSGSHVSRSARRTTSTRTRGFAAGASRCTSRPGLARRSSSSARRPATAAPRVSGLPFTSERQLTGCGPAEATATIVHRVLERLGLAADVLLWNVVPTHPGTESSNRPPTRAEAAAAEPFLAELARGRRVVAVGRLAAAVTGAPYVRHPSHGGAAAFEAGLRALTGTQAPVRLSA
jgi:hypothetical protein